MAQQNTAAFPQDLEATGGILTAPPGTMAPEGYTVVNYGSKLLFLSPAAAAMYAANPQGFITAHLAELQAAGYSYTPPPIITSGPPLLTPTPPLPPAPPLTAPPASGTVDHNVIKAWGWSQDAQGNWIGPNGDVGYWTPDGRFVNQTQNKIFDPATGSLKDFVVPPPPSTDSEPPAEGIPMWVWLVGAGIGAYFLLGKGK